MSIYHAFSPGQLANRLFSSANIYAYAKGVGRPFRAKTLGLDAGFMQSLKGDGYELMSCSELRRKSFAALDIALVHKSLNLPGVGFHFAGMDRTEHLRTPDDAMKKVLAHGSSWLIGYRYRSWGDFFALAQDIRRDFAFGNDYTQQTVEYFDGLGLKRESTAGLHIRRGDYSAWLDGKYFYDWSEYRTIAENILAGNPQIKAIVATGNEPIPEGTFSGLPVHPGPGHRLKDMIALSLCSVVAGPPSTYSSWAAYIGETGICHVEKDLAVKFIEFDEPYAASCHFL